MATLTIELGVPVSITAPQLAELNGETPTTAATRIFPNSKVPGLTAASRSKTMSGTPTTAGTYAQDYGIYSGGYWKYGTVTIEVFDPNPPEPEPEPEPTTDPVFDSETGIVTLTRGIPVSVTAVELARFNGDYVPSTAKRNFPRSEVPGLTTPRYGETLSGTPTIPGTYVQEYGGGDASTYMAYGEVTIKVVDSSGSEPTDPEPEPEPTDPEPTPTDPEPETDPVTKTMNLTLGVPVSIKAEDLAALNGEDISKGTKRVFNKSSVPGLSAGYLSAYLSGVPSTEGIFLQDYGRDELGYTRSGAVNIVVRAEAPPVIPEDPEVPADPSGRPDPHPDSQRLLRSLGYDQTTKWLAIADEHLATVTTFVYGYTRGNGFEMEGFASDPRPVPKWDLRKVILSAASRSVSNPQQLRQMAAGDYSETPSTFTGWTLPEIAVLHRYRKRTR